MPYKDPEKRKRYNKEYQKGWRKEHPEHKTYPGNLPERKHARYVEWVRKNPEKKLWDNARKRAKKNGIEFSIEPSDIVIPEVCPIFGMRLERGSGGTRLDSSPSLDRLDNNKGYIKGNVWVISWRANHLKSNASLEELEKLIFVLKRKLTCPT